MLGRVNNLSNNQIQTTVIIVDISVTVTVNEYNTGSASSIVAVKYK